MRARVAAAREREVGARERVAAARETEVGARARAAVAMVAAMMEVNKVGATAVAAAGVAVKMVGERARSR